MRAPLCALLLSSWRQASAQSMQSISQWAQVDDERPSWALAAPPRADPLACADAAVSIPATCTDSGTLCLARVGGYCPDGCNLDESGTICTGTAICDPPELGECQEGCVYTPGKDAVCPVGCWLVGAVCTECPPEYAACGRYGGCHPAGPLLPDAEREADEQGEESSDVTDTPECVCLDGFVGELCEAKRIGLGGYIIFAVSIAIICSCLCVFSVQGYFRVDRYSWKWETYQMTPIFGLVVDTDLVVSFPTPPSVPSSQSAHPPACLPAHLAVRAPSRLCARAHARVRVSQHLSRPRRLSGWSSSR